VKKEENKNLVPVVDGEWWTIAGNPDLGSYNTDKQQPLDFAIWQAADETWQMVACCRRTACGGRGRLFYRWQADKLTDTDWKPMGVFMEADTNFGEYEGGLQAPMVYKHKDEYLMYYGDWINTCMAWSQDGKTFARLLGEDKLSGLFTEGHKSSTRDPHVMAWRNKFYIYYTGVPEDKGQIFCRMSDDLYNWGDSVVVNSGGSGGSGSSDAECPFVLYQPEEALFYLFRAHPSKNGDAYETSVYASPDPLDFGIDTDKYKIGSLPFEVVRIIEHDHQFYISALKHDYTGMILAKLKWVRE
jgi:hypothetical protein